MLYYDNDFAVLVNFDESLIWYHMESSGSSSTDLEMTQLQSSLLIKMFMIDDHRGIVVLEGCLSRHFSISASETNLNR